MLALTGLAKAWSAVGPARVLDAADPIVGIPFRQLLLAIGLMELLIAFFCLFTDKRQLSLLLVAWLSANFLVYRLSLWWMGWHRPCGCMGKLTDALHISEQTADNIMKVVLACLLIGSYGLLLWQWWLARRSGSKLLHVSNKKQQEKYGLAAASRIQSWTWGGFVAAMVLNVTASAYEYELQGKVAGSQYFVNGKVQKLETIRFHAYVRGCAWLIRLVPEAGGDFSKRIEYWETASDGEVFYRFAALKPGVPGRDRWEATVTKEAVPPGTLLPQASAAWLAVVSTCYLDAAGEKLVPAYSREFVRLPLRAHVVRHVQEPRLPENIVFLADGYDPRFGPPKRLPPPFDAGFTNAVFAARDFNQIGGLALPLAFSLDVYQPGQGGLVIEYEYRGTVDQTRTNCALDNFLPRLRAGTEGEIKDLRFISADSGSQNPFNYFTYRSARWLSEAEARNLPDFAAYTQWEARAKAVPVVAIKGDSDARPPSKLGRTALGALLAGSTLALIFLWRRTLKEDKPQ